MAVTPEQMAWLIGLLGKVSHATFQQLRWLWSACVKANPLVVNKATVKAGLKGVAFKDGLSELGQTARLYLAILGLDKPLKEPGEREGFEKVTTIARGITAPMLVEAIRAMGVTVCVDGDSTTPLNPKLVIEPRSANKGAYTIRHRGCVDADVELKGKSSNDLRVQGVAHMTLTERLLFEVAHRLETGCPLDPETVTICLARDPDGRVWVVCWGDGRLYVDRGNPDRRDGSWRGREVVSSPPAEQAG